MKRLLLRSSAVIAIVAVVALFATGSFSPASWVHRLRSAGRVGSAESSTLVPSAFERVWAQVTALLPGKSARPAGTRTVLLSEPVTILRSPGFAGANLEKGTAVDFIASEGRFVRVRHADAVITIPRSATVTGAFRVN